MTTYDVRVKAVEHNTNTNEVARKKIVELLDVVVFWIVDGVITTGLIFAVQGLYLLIDGVTGICMHINEVKIQFMVAPVIFACGFYLTKWLTHKARKWLYKKLSK